MEVDLVYLWVDSNDKKIEEKRIYWQEKLGKKVNEQAVAEYRFINSDELKYSLRSVEKFAPWINNIYIVTDNQIPNWLNTANRKIKIVDHTEIMPADALPCFNSIALETMLHKIPGLSEYFIFSNDDMFFANPTEKSFFFDKDMKPVFRIKHKIKPEQIEKEIYFHSLHNSYKLIENKYNFKIDCEPHHSIDAYRKSHFEQVNEIFRDEITKTTYSKFRDFSNISRVIYSSYSCAINEGILRKVRRVDRNLPFYKQVYLYLTKQFKKDSACFGTESTNIENEIKKYKPNVICINDDEGSTNDSRKAMKTFLETYFDQKSSFEQ